MKGRMRAEVEESTADKLIETESRIYKGIEEPLARMEKQEATILKKLETLHLGLKMN